MSLEQSSIMELMEIRRGLEVQAAYLAARRKTAHDMETLYQAVKEMRNQMHDLEAYIRLDVEFHLAIAAASHNSMMGYLVESIRDALRGTVSAGLQSRGPNLDLETIQQTHEKLLNVIETGDPEGAMHAMLYHFDEAIYAMQQAPK